MLRYILIPTLMVLNLGMSATAAPTTSKAMAARRSPVMAHDPEPLVPYLPRANAPALPVNIKGLSPKVPRAGAAAAVPASLMGRQMKNPVPNVPMGPNPEADVPAGLHSRQMEKNHDWSGHAQPIPATQPDPQPAPPAPAPAPQSDAKPVAARQLSGLGVLSGAGAPAHNANASPNADANASPSPNASPNANASPKNAAASNPAGYVKLNDMTYPKENSLPGLNALPVAAPALSKA